MSYPKSRVSKVLLGVTGSIAAYKSAELVRALVKEGFDVDVVMTQDATMFITPLTLATLCGKQVLTDMFESGHTIPHIQKARESDIIVIAPATAETISRLAVGSAESLLTAIVLASGKKPVLIAPAMNINMWDHPATVNNVKTLQEYGYRFIGPDSGELACGESGSGRLAEIHSIVEEIKVLLHSDKRLAGKSVIVTASRTVEAIDPVRYISNRSSGKMGYWLARVLRRWGANVTLISGPSELSAPYGVKTVMVESAEQMKCAVMDNLRDADMLFMASAVSDYRSKHSFPQKIKKTENELLIELERTPDILKEASSIKGDRIFVGFAAESENLTENAISKLKEKNLDAVVANSIAGEGSAFGSDFNDITLILKDGTMYRSGRMKKEEVAEFIVQRVCDSLL